MSAICKLLYFWTLFSSVSLVFSANDTDWEGTLVFSEDFNGDALRNYFWESEEGCEEVRHLNMAQECFLHDTNNLEVGNGTLVLRAGMIEYDNKILYTTGRVRGSGFGFTYGTYVIRAKLPEGKHLFPAFYILPLNQHLDKCKYEEIDIMEYRGERTSTLLFSAKYGRDYNNVYKRSLTKVFPSIDFSKDFHTFAVKWLPTRIEWYVDMVKIYEVNTHFVNDWTNGAGDNLPCSKNKKPFERKSNLFISLSVGGAKNFPPEQFGNLTFEDARFWAKPTLEIDWVRVYNDKAKSRTDIKLKTFGKRKGESGSPITEGPISTGYLK